MRTLFIMRGAPGSGKSTLIKRYGLEPYTISADNLRLLYSSPTLAIHLSKEDVDNGDQGFRIDTKIESKVWSTIREILEERMKVGAFTVIDATHATQSNILAYKKLAEQYRYRVYCIDLSKVSDTELFERNKTRESLKKVPEYAINRMITRLHTSKVPPWVKTLTPDNIKEGFYNKPEDLSCYKKIHFIGDIHGSYSVLMKYLNDNGGIKEDEYYIFLGDFTDRGVENVEIINFLLENYQRSNICLLEGNHERWVKIWAEGGVGRSPEFENVTRQQLDSANFNLKEVRQLYRKINQCKYIKYKDKVILATHGGLSTLPGNLTLVSTEEMIKGTGRYNDMIDVDESFINTTSENVYQVHCHRNIQKVPIQVNERCFNLCETVEFGDNLRCLQLTKDGFTPIYTKNEVLQDF